MHRIQLRLIVALTFTITTLTVAAPASAHRTDSMVQGAVSDAVNSIDGNHGPSLVTASSSADYPSGYNCLAASMRYTARNVFDGRKVTFTVVQTTVPQVARWLDGHDFERKQ